MKFSIKKVATSIGATGALVLAGAKSAFAQNPGSLDVNTINPLQPIRTGSLTNTISNVIGIILWVIGLLAVIYLIYGGVMYITAGGDAEKAAKGRTAITNAIIGIVIIVLAILIYNFVLNLGQ